MKYWLGSCLLLGSWIVGCSSNDTATEADYDDIAQAVSALITTDSGGGEVGSMYDATAIATGTSDINTGATGKYAGKHLGLEYEYEVDCVGAEGDASKRCGRATDHANAKVNWSGNLELPHVSASVQREGEWNLSDIQSGIAEFNGSGMFDLDVQIQSLFRITSRDYQVSYSAQYTKVKFEISRRRITGGTINYVIDAQRLVSGPRRESSANFHMDGLVEFAEDGQATLTLDKSFRYTIDTESGLVVKK